MLSIFDQSESEQQPDRKLNLDRLQTVLDSRRFPTDERPGTVTLEEPPKVKLAPPPVRHFEPRPSAAAPAPQAKSAPLPAPQDDAIPAQLSEFAEQFTRGFRQVLASTVKDIQGPALDDRRKVEDLKSELDSAHQKIDALVSALQELTQRLNKAEDTVVIATTAAHATRDAQQAIEKRLDMQAGVLRTLHNGTQSREERLDKLLSTFQSLQNMDSQPKPLNTLPDSL